MWDFNHISYTFDSISAEAIFHSFIGILKAESSKFQIFSQNILKNSKFPLPTVNFIHKTYFKNSQRQIYRFFC